MRALRILFVVNSLGIGGAEKHVVALVNQLDPVRFTASLAHLKADGPLLAQIDRDRIGGRIFHAGVTRKFDLAALRRLAQVVDEQKIDLVLCTNSYSLLYGSLAARLAQGRPPVIEVFHTTSLGGRKERLQMALYRPFFRRAAAVVFVCAAQRQHWLGQRLRLRRSEVIYNGIDVDYFKDHTNATDKRALRAQYGFSAEDYVVGLCAVFRPEKAHGDLLQAAARLKARGHPVKCLLIGDGPQRSAIEAQIAALGLQEEVRITGFLQDVRAHIAACDVIALVSHFVETFSIAALEAMALGKPMIMSDIGGAAEQVEPGVHGMLFPAGDIDQLAAALNALRDPVACTAMGTNARARVAREFAVETMVSRFETLLHDVVVSGGSVRA